MPRRLGIIVGINQYQDPTFRPLQFAEHDATAFGQWLVNAQGGNWNPGDVQLLQGAYATRAQVETLIMQACVNMAEPGDLVLIYFAGHAYVDEAQGEGYLALANTHYQQPSTGIRLLTLAQQTMGRSRAANVLFMLDCFQTGQIWSNRRASPYDAKPLLSSLLLNALQQGSGRVFLCSCRGNELAPETGERGLGLLMHRTIVGLCGSAADPATGQMTLQRLHSFLFSALGERHRPQLFGQEQSPLVLVGNMPPAPQSFSSPTSLAAPHPRPVQSTSTGSLFSHASQQSATAQMSPTASGALALSAMEQQRQQQSVMLLRQAHHLIQMNNPGEAFNVIEQALRIAPNDVAALIVKGQLLGTAGRFQEALAIVEQVAQLDAGNALAWSMRAALLTNMGQYPPALHAVEHSLKLDPNDPETYAIKTTIMNHMAQAQRSGPMRGTGAGEKRDGSASFMRGFAVQLLALLLGVAGIALLVFVSRVPGVVGVALASIGLAILCVNAARGSYLYGFGRLLLTLVSSILTAMLLGGAFAFEYTRVTFTHQHFRDVIAHPSLFVPLLFAGSWLALATILPLFVAIGGLIGRLVSRGRRKHT